MRRSPTSLLFPLLTFLAFALPCLGANVTVDDEYGDELTGALPDFLPEGSWSQGNECTSCAFQPNASAAFGNSWHDTTFYAGGSERSINFNFTGTAVYAFFIVPDALNGDESVLTDLGFAIDGELVGNFTHHPQNTAKFIYNDSCYANESLSNGPHQLVISASAPANQSSVVLFDYLIYTTPESNSTNTTSSISSTRSIASASSDQTSSSTSSSASPSVSNSRSSHSATINIGGTIGILGTVAFCLLCI